MELDQLQTPKITLDLSDYVQALLGDAPKRYILINQRQALLIQATNNHELVCRVEPTDLKDKHGKPYYYLVAIDGMEAFKALQDRIEARRKEKIEQWSLSDKTRKRCVALLQLTGHNKKKIKEILSNKDLFNKYKEIFNLPTD